MHDMGMVKQEVYCEMHFKVLHLKCNELIWHRKDRVVKHREDNNPVTAPALLPGLNGHTPVLEAV